MKKLSLLISFDSLKSFSGGIATFTCTKANYIVNQSAASQVNVYNDNNASMSIVITKPVVQSFTIPSHQWIKITLSGITDSIPNPTDSITNPVSTVMVMGDTMLIGNKYTDLIGHVANVQLYDNLDALGVDSTAPFTVGFAPITTGLHTLNAVLTDSLGNTVTSPSINVSVNNFEAEFFTKDSTGSFDVDLNYSNDTALVNMKAHGWLEYSVDVNHTGKYNLYATLLNNVTANSFSISIDGLPAANSGTALGTIAIPVSANYQTIKKDSFDISTGRHTLRVTFNNDIAGVDYFRLNYYYPIAAFLQAAAFSDTGSFATGINHGYLYPMQLDESYGGGVIFSNLDSNWVEYKVNIPTATTYSLQLHMANKWSSTGKYIEIYANGAFIQRNSFPSSTWSNSNTALTLADADATITFANAGPQTLRFKTYGSSTRFWQR